MDIVPALRDTSWMLRAESLRERLAGTLRAAFAEGLLSEKTLSHRLALVFGPPLIEPRSVVGDLALRAQPRRPGLAGLAASFSSLREELRRSIGYGGGEPAALVLALDWSGAREEILIGREPSCDIALRSVTVSRRHALLRFRDGAWIVSDLSSTNGITVNGARVGRCQLRPGDRLGLGLALLDVD
jgi:hypothetical protein